MIQRFAGVVGVVAIAVAIAYGAERIRDILHEKPPVAAEESAGVPEPLPPLPSLVSLGDGYAFSTLENEKFLLLRREGDRVRLVRLYHLVRDPERHMGKEELRSAHRYYLDDEGEALLAEIEGLHQAFDRATRIDSMSAAEAAKAEESARNLLRLGDVRFLADRLKSEEYAVRRASALALGEAGYLAAVPVLIELLQEKDPLARRRAHLALVVLTGVDYLEEGSSRVPDRAIRAWEGWWAAHAPKSPFARMSSPGEKKAGGQ